MYLEVTGSISFSQKVSLPPSKFCLELIQNRKLKFFCFYKDPKFICCQDFVNSESKSEFFFNFSF